MAGLRLGVAHHGIEAGFSFGSGFEELDVGVDDAVLLESTETVEEFIGIERERESMQVVVLEAASERGVLRICSRVLTAAEVKELTLDRGVFRVPFGRSVDLQRCGGRRRLSEVVGATNNHRGGDGRGAVEIDGEGEDHCDAFWLKFRDNEVRELFEDIGGLCELGRIEAAGPRVRFDSSSD